MRRKNIAIIPARGGSKRVKNKNIIDFHGKPLIAYTIQAAIKSKLFDRIIVSTDAKEISDIAIEYGAEVPFLRKVYADDHSPVSVATLDCVLQTESHYNEVYENVIQLMAVCPLRTAEDIKNARDYFVDNKLEFLVSCSEFPLMEPYWAHTLDKDNNPKPCFPKELTKRSQDLKPVYCPSGAIWIAKKESLIKENSFYGKNHKFFPISWISAVDIDTHDDLMVAQKLYLRS